MTFDCSLTIAGVEIATTPDALHQGIPTALDGLSIPWGRQTRLDQPTSSTMSMRIAVPTAAVADTVTQIAPGERVTVTATSTTEVTHETIIQRGYQTITQTAPAYYAPGPTQPDGANPAAWDHLPTAARGAFYTATLNVTALPPTARVRIYPVYYTGPWEQAATLGPEIATATRAGTISATFTPDAAYQGNWVSIALHISPAGPQWFTMTNTWGTYTQTWADLARTTISNLALTRDGASSKTSTVFYGRVSDAVLKWSDTLDMPTLSVTAVDFTAEHANMRIGSDPWPVETAAARIARIIETTGQKITTVIDPAPGRMTLAPIDVDSQSPSTLLKDVATSTGAILWPSAHHTLGEYYRLEDLNGRISLYTLHQSADGTAYLDVSAKGATEIPANTIDRALTIERDTTDLATVVTVDWSEQTTDPDGTISQTSRTATATDPDRLGQYGYRSLHITTDLNSETQAATLAAQTLARSAAGGWTIPAATWDTTRPGSTDAAIAQVLDATTRMGLPIILTGVDDWVPGAPNIPVYLDGGSYTYQDGHWTLNLQLTRAATPGQSILWRQLPATLTWARMGTLTWADLSSVSA
ncbi:hypothetical protein [Schaalia sp. ZJ1691]|uniref:hypothetical protein n=1 Tax=Schaalia sp. ZJ1691 TaxID=2709404 RepID=UPI0013ED9FD9|nr:hypothetical protein [Schaalia sp. ZJ1691]